MKIIFDNSIHLGQFCINNETTRIAAKNSQVLISSKSNTKYIGIESFNENTFSDDIIWELPREPQDIFYKFMDTYHSVKNISRIPLDTNDIKSALKISSKFKINISNALTCSIAIRTGAKEVHSFYSDFKKVSIVNFLAKFSINICVPLIETENKFTEDELEKYYNDALNSFKKHKIDLTKKFHI